MSIFQTVKENVTARQAAEQYGLRISRNGMICCPFHDDRHPSMKVDNISMRPIRQKGQRVNFGKILQEKISWILRQAAQQGNVLKGVSSS